MKKLLATGILLLSLGGCYINPPLPPFPAVPDKLMEPAEPLTQLNKEKVELSDIIDNTAINADRYYKLKEKYQAWQEWYKDQQKLYGKLK